VANGQIVVTKEDFKRREGFSLKKNFIYTTLLSSPKPEPTMVTIIWNWAIPSVTTVTTITMLTTITLGFAQGRRIVMDKKEIRRALDLIIEQAKLELSILDRDDYVFDANLMISKAVDIVLKDDEVIVGYVGQTYGRL